MRHKGAAIAILREYEKDKDEQVANVAAGALQRKS